MIAIDVRTGAESLFVHLASTIDKGIEWIKEHGEDWFEEPYQFALYSVEVDKEVDCFSYEDLIFVDKNGTILK